MSPPNVFKEPLDGETKNLDHAVVCQGGPAGLCVLLSVPLHLYGCFETSCCAIDCFDYSYAPAAVAGGCAVLPDSLNKVFEHGLVSANLADSGGGSALVLAPGGMIDKARLTVAEVGRNDAIVFENNCAQRSGNFQPSRITGINSRGRLKSVDSTNRKLEDYYSGVFGFDGMQHSRRACLNASDVTEQPQQQIDRVHALVH